TDDIKKFNKQNNISVNVFEIDDDKKINPIHREHFNANPNIEDRKCNLLLYKNHYVLCKNMNTFSNNNHSNFLCLNCFNSYRSEILLNEHIQLCQEHKEVKSEFPKEDYCEFKNYYFRNKNPFVIYSDFECYNTNINKNISDDSHEMFMSEANTKIISE